LTEEEGMVEEDEESVRESEKRERDN